MEEYKSVKVKKMKKLLEGLMREDSSGLGFFVFAFNFILRKFKNASMKQDMSFVQ